MNPDKQTTDMFIRYCREQADRVKSMRAELSKEEATLDRMTKQAAEMHIEIYT